MTESFSSGGAVPIPRLPQGRADRWTFLEMAAGLVIAIVGGSLVCLIAAAYEPKD